MQQKFPQLGSIYINPFIPQLSRHKITEIQQVNK